MSGAAATKERLYAQLASKLGRLSAALGETSRSMETLRTDVHAMQTLAGLHGSQYVLLLPAWASLCTLTCSPDSWQLRGYLTSRTRLLPRRRKQKSKNACAYTACPERCPCSLA